MRKNWMGAALAAAWLATYALSRWGAEVLERGSPALVAISLLPALPFMALMREVVVGIRGSDELERRVHLEALAVAFPLTILLLMVLGLLELAVDLDPADWSYRHLWPFAVLFWLGGLVLARRRYA
jgi:hypothetical protein